MKKWLVVLLFFANFAFSQSYDIGKVTIDELKEKRHPIDTSAAAAILFNRCHVIVDDNKYTSVSYSFEMKIKIYKKEGFDYANFEKRYFGRKDTNSLTLTDVATYNLVDGAIEKTKVEDDGIFISQEGKTRQLKQVIFPNVREGSIIEYRFTFHTFQYFRLQDFYFQYDIPVNYVQYSVRIPKDFRYNKSLYGFLQLDKGETYDDYTNFEKNAETSTKKTYSFKNVPAMREEAYVNNINNYRGRLTYEIASRPTGYGGFKNYSNNWDTIIKKIYKEEFVEELKVNNYFKNDLEPVLTGLTSTEEKIKAIFTYVQSRMNWDSYVSYWCDLGIKKAHKEKKGNSADINLMLVAMLRTAGLNANPVLISTRRNGIALSPGIIAFNQVIACVEVENERILLDASDKNAYINILPIRDLNWMGRLVKGEASFAQINIMPKTVSKDIVNLIASINADGSIDGKIKNQYLDHDAYVFRSYATDLPNEKLSENIEKKYKSIEISDYEFLHKTELDKPAIESYNFKQDNFVEFIGNKMYFSPMLFFALTETPFKLDTREYPIDFAYPNQDKYLITITIPDGYTVETLPQSVSIPMSDNKGSLKYLIAHNEKQIQLSVTMEINSAIIAAEYYEELKGFFAEVVKKQTEKIILKKV